MSNSNFTHTSLSGQPPFETPKCSTYGVLRTDCINDKPRETQSISSSFISWNHLCHSDYLYEGAYEPIESLHNAIAVLRKGQSGRRRSPSDWLIYKLDTIRRCATSCDIGLRTCMDRAVFLYRCHSPTCLFCCRKDMEQNIAKYQPLLKGFKRPVFITPTIMSDFNPRIAINRLYNGIERFKDLRIGKRNLKKWHRWMCEEVKKYFALQLWGLLEWGLWCEAFIWLAWKKTELQIWFWKRFEKRCKEFMGRGLVNLRLYHLLIGIGKLEITYNGFEGYHPHLHLLFDGFFIPQVLLSRIWKEITGSCVVDTRVAYRNYHQELLKYVAKPWELEGLSDKEKGQLLYALSNRKKILIFGLKLTNMAKNYCPNCEKRKGIECKLALFSRTIRKKARQNEECGIVSLFSSGKSVELGRINFLKGKQLTYDRYMKMRKDLDEVIEGSYGVEIFWDFEKRKLSWRTQEEFLCGEGCYSMGGGSYIVQYLMWGLENTS